ncbi:MAG: hypothetical protein ICV67_05310 [Thermoleophilia bacterium]|nr:hypothetical protein [Thermoleophilia bacterium]
MEIVMLNAACQKRADDLFGRLEPGDDPLEVGRRVDDSDVDLGEHPIKVIAVVGMRLEERRVVLILRGVRRPLSDRRRPLDRAGSGSAGRR